MRSTLSKTEMILLAACVCLAFVGLFGPAVGQPANYHDFADARFLWGLPFAMDVLSNLPFAIAGCAGIGLLLAMPSRDISNVQRAMTLLFCVGLVLTALASSWYHWQPDDAGLAIDRTGMAIAFAGLLGLAAASRISERAGAVVGLGVLLLAPLCIKVWSNTGNVLPWAVLQFGGMGLVVWIASLRVGHSALPVRWGFVILAYAAAKLLELNDGAIFEFTGHLVSGHTLKHVVASLAAVPVIYALGELRNPVQNAAGIGGRLASRRVRNV
jgi:hypothetical protein